MARINVDSGAPHDPRIAKRLPRFTGLGRHDAFGRLLLVWGVGYDRKTIFIPEIDIDDAAEHEGFAAAMVKAALADPTADPGVLRVRGLYDRIGYLLNQKEAARKGGLARRDQLDGGGGEGRGERGRFVRKPTTDQPDAGDDQPDAGDPPADHQPSGTARAGLHQPTTSRSAPDLPLPPDLDLDLIAVPPAPLQLSHPAPPAPAPAAIKPAKAKAAPIAGSRETVALFTELFHQQTGAKPTWGEKQGAQLKRLLQLHGADQVQLRITRLFGGELGDWCKRPYDVGTLVTHFDKLAPITRPQLRAVPNPTPDGPTRRKL